jgi:hypothetical protein
MMIDVVMLMPLPAPSETVAAKLVLTDNYGGEHNRDDSLQGGAVDLSDTTGSRLAPGATVGHGGHR